ncbi:MAG: hypothetical protein MUC64_06995 [Rubritepida sp.]|jgi:hypothetical protein|nr:hypothetical protein [Rubritepida sp.]
MTEALPVRPRAIAAISERDAQGEIAAIYADIRATFRAGVVNLLWRHLATIDGALPWAWTALKPLFAGGHIAAAANGFRATRPLPRVLRLPREALACAGLGIAAQADVTNLLAAYDRVNPLSLIASQLLRDALAGQPSATVWPGAPAQDVGSPLPLPPLPDLDALPPTEAALVLRLNRLGSIGPEPVLTSLYRHLALWPGALALAYAVLAPLDAAGELQAAGTASLRLAEEHAAPLEGLIPTADLPPCAAALDAALGRLIEDSLMRMTVAASVLRAAFPG